MTSGRHRPEDDDRDWLRQAKDQQAAVRQALMLRLFGPADDHDQHDQHDDADPGPEAA